MTPPRAAPSSTTRTWTIAFQLTGGLYGALVVLPPHARRDANKRLIDSPTPRRPTSRDTPPSLIDGSSVPVPIELCAEVRPSFPFGRYLRRVRKAEDCACSTTPRSCNGNRWQKDGQELRPLSRPRRSLQRGLIAGETRNVAFTPSHPGTFTLEVTSAYNVPRVTRVPMIAKECGAHEH